MGAGIRTTTPYKGIIIRKVLLNFEFLKPSLASNLELHYDEFQHSNGHRMKISPRFGFVGILKKARRGWEWISFEQFLDEIPPEHQAEFLFHLDLFS
jgi:hypothetical protein